jgi:DNA polymerase III subunit epsilon
VAAPEEQDHSLEAIAARLGVSVVGRHTALGDAILTGEIFLKQLRLLAAQGFVTLGEAREAARRTYVARRSESLYSRA